MRCYLQSVLLALILATLSIVLAQEGVADETTTVERNANEMMLLQQQQVIDSLVRLQIRREMDEATGDRQRMNELEARLASISREDSIRKYESIKKIDQFRKSVRGYAVSPFADTIFTVYVKSANLSPDLRAEAISERISKIASEPFFNADQLSLSLAENRYEIKYKDDLLIMTISEDDAIWSDYEQSDFADHLLVKIKESIASYRSENSIKNWLLRILKIILIIVFIGFIVYSINKMFHKINSFLDKNKDKYLSGITIKNIKIITPEFHETIAKRINNILRVFFILFIIYLALPLLFSVFPETKELTDTLLGWVFDPMKAAAVAVVEYLPNLFTILVIYFIFKYTIKAAKFFVDQIETGEIKIGGFHQDWAQPTFKILKFLSYAFMVVLIFPYLPGSDSAVFQGVSIFIGVLFSLGSSNAIANMVAGLVITYMRPFKVGDRIKIGDVTGDVIEKTLLVTRICTAKNEEITVPNSTVLSSNTTNYSTFTKNESDGLIIHTTVTIGYDVPWELMHSTLIEAAKKTEHILDKPEPFVLQTGLEDFYVSYQLNAFTKNVTILARIYSQMHQNIQDCCNKNGIEILSPHYRAVRDGNHTTIPMDYLPNDYIQPAFNTKQQKHEGKS